MLLFWQLGGCRRELQESSANCAGSVYPASMTVQEQQQVGVRCDASICAASVLACSFIVTVGANLFVRRMVTPCGSFAHSRTGLTSGAMLSFQMWSQGTLVLPSAAFECTLAPVSLTKCQALLFSCCGLSLQITLLAAFQPHPVTALQNQVLQTYLWQPSTGRAGQLQTSSRALC